ncbi:unnamed protein product [Paramecium sonneborni]|uniref:Uncharacterized protein n=1 Tax=Paramecium sonneborni TaxID=65129 RepID=A0A8S1RGH3_9CILI|nr:unnamed protein product [Paramecium sonneborni]
MTQKVSAIKNIHPKNPSNILQSKQSMERFLQNSLRYSKVSDQYFFDNLEGISDAINHFDDHFLNFSSSISTFIL